MRRQSSIESQPRTNSNQISFDEGFPLRRIVSSTSQIDLSGEFVDMTENNSHQLSKRDTPKFINRRECEYKF